MTQGRLDDLMFLFIRKQVTKNINYDEVIEKFKVMIPAKRRLELQNILRKIVIVFVNVF